MTAVITTQMKMLISSPTSAISARRKKRDLLKLCLKNYNILEGFPLLRQDLKQATIKQRKFRNYQPNRRVLLNLRKRLDKEREGKQNLIRIHQIKQTQYTKVFLKQVRLLLGLIVQAHHPRILLLIRF